MQNRIVWESHKGTGALVGNHMISETDANLITQSNEWLERARIFTASKMDQLATELRSIMNAQQFKQRLANNNLMAIQDIIQDDSGEIVDVVVKIVDLDAARKIISKTQYTESAVNAMIQAHNIKSDGYDL